MQRLVLVDLGQLGILLVGLSLIACGLHAVERYSGRVVAQRLGWNGVLITGWLGVPLHELSHLVTAKLFRHRIVGVAFFDPDPATGTLGYVRHAYSKRTAWQLVGNFVIGVAPLLAGAAALAALVAWMIGADELLRLVRLPSRTLHDVADLRFVCHDALALAVRVVRRIWAGRSCWLPLQLYLCICVATHCAPSGADLAGAWPGGVLLTVLLVAAAFIAGSCGVHVVAPTVPLVLTVAIAIMASLFQALWALTARLIGR